MKKTLQDEELEKLFEQSGYDPERIGIRLLRRAGYYVKYYAYSDAISVCTKDSTPDNPKILFHRKGA